MDVKYIGGDVPWTLPFGDHFYSSSQTSLNETKKTSLSSASDLDLIARRHGFEPLYLPDETESQTKFSNQNSQWMNSGVLFTDKKIPHDITGIHKTDFVDNHGHTFCYLCSINAHEHERTKPRDPSLRRKLIPYNNPKALKARSASIDRPKPSSNFTSYRFVIRTGTRENSGTRAQVFLYMYGTENNWTSINLQSAQGNKNSHGFPSGSIRTFCLKGPDIGQLHHLNVNVVGARSDKEWFLKEIEITNLDTSVTWLCEFNCWLPKKEYEEEKVQARPTIDRHNQLSFDNLAVYILQVRTGGKPFAGTDANIQVVIRGSTGQIRRLALTSDRANLFEQNQLDTFAIVGWDIGELIELTVESDRSQLAANWDLKEMLMWKILPYEKRKVIQGYFSFNAWLGKEKSTLKTKKDTYSPTEFHPRGPTCYQIEIKTGNKSNAGTDANVYLIIYGKNGRTSIHHLDNLAKNDFEKGTISQFTIMDFDVGDIEQIKIWHDNTGIGSAWFLESVSIRKKHSTSRTVTSIYTQRLEQTSKILYHQATEQIKKVFGSLKSNDLDDLSSYRGILRSPIIPDRASLQKKVTWNEQSADSQDDPIRINAKQMKDKQKLVEQKHQKETIDSGHFDHQVYWISSHNYLNNKWQIQSIEERNRLKLDESIRSILLSDRLVSNEKIKQTFDEKEDEVYEFEANCWLEKTKTENKLEVYLTPKSKRSSKHSTNDLRIDDDFKRSSRMKSEDLHSSQRSPLENYKRQDDSIRSSKHSTNDLRTDDDFKRSSRMKSEDLHLSQRSPLENYKRQDDLIRSSKYDLGPLDKSPRMKSDDLRSSQRSPLEIYKRQDDSYRSPSRDSNELSKTMTSDRELIKRMAHEPPYNPRSTATSLIDTRTRSPRLEDELSKTTMKTSNEPSFRPKSAVRSTPELSTRRTTTRDQVYSSAYGTIDEF